MTIAVVEAMLSDKDWSRSLLAERFVAVYKRDRRLGYAKRFQTLLDEVESGEELLTRLRPESNKSGAAMRSVPLGRYKSVSELLAKCELQAKITHDTEGGVESAQAVSLLAHYLHFDLGPTSGVGEYIQRELSGDWATPWSGEVGSEGIASARAAVTAVMSSASLSEILRKSVEFTGDVDTVACVACGAASLSEKIAKDLPAVLVEGLEEGEYGRTYLRSLDERLMSSMR